VTALRVTLVALFPDAVRPYLDASILGRAQKDGLLVVDEEQIRDHAHDKHKNVDDTPSGGGPGLVMKADVVVPALEAAAARDEAAHAGAKRRVILMDPAGEVFTQAHAKRLAGYEHLVLVCGRYEGLDARVYEFVDERLSIGDFVLTGGEIAAAVVVDAVAREREGVLGNAQSSADESHQQDRLEHRQYTRPNEYRGLKVPRVLLSGDHGRIAKARARDALLQTREKRPDLWEKLSDEERALTGEGEGLAPEKGEP
jgi:tRNA (guanine37-N1)-methyltransferase